MQNEHSSFGKIYVITVYHADIYGRYCIQKSNNDYFHPYFDIIVLKMKGSSFPVVYLHKLNRDFFHWQFFAEKPRDIDFLPSVLKRAQRWRIS